jgi:hypothetical protein
LATSAAELWARFVEFVSWGHARSPELMIGLGILVLLPPLAVLGLVLHRRPRRSATPRSVPDAGYVADWRRQITVEIEGSGQPPRPIAAGLTRIGRQDDNEICIADTSVHRYHAAIERSAESGVIICDLSGPKGNGIRINGNRVGTSPLRHGDVVEVGKARLHFTCTTLEDRFEDATAA